MKNGVGDETTDGHLDDCMVPPVIEIDGCAVVLAHAGERPGANETVWVVRCFSYDEGVGGTMGVYSTPVKAQEVADRAKTDGSWNDGMTGFLVDKFVLDVEPEWWEDDDLGSY